MKRNQIQHSNARAHTNEYANFLGDATAQSRLSAKRVSLGRAGVLALLSSAVLLTSGCMTSAMVAQKIENAGNIRDLKAGTAQLRAHISKLQAAGDPLGDYYYAMGNADGWITDVKDPQAITALFEQAAAKGSMDAKILLALQIATGEAVPGRLDYGKGPSRADLYEWERGLVLLMPLLQQQCYARRLALELGSPVETAYSIANNIWPKFRDGYYRHNPDGTRTFLKGDPARQEPWEVIAVNCQMPADKPIH